MVATAERLVDVGDCTDPAQHDVENEVVRRPHWTYRCAVTVVRCTAECHQSQLQRMVRRARGDGDHHVDIVDGANADRGRVGDQQFCHLPADEHDLAEQRTEPSRGAKKPITSRAALHGVHALPVAAGAARIRSRSTGFARVRSRVRPRRMASTSASNS